ncbi:N-methylhydantoinase A/oxoprolinase/acetone carboxylase, beta subunit [Solimonas aquatica]|uniref:N-methylhydantoinase A/oxoprolinase/acetone carboxylase, beta subunit n=1 Tax=Solimonas aquatica TaxID=489703 RepID=A0A1H9E4J9_9GAMM|nr:hydantoinase/oxoprolinase family protein [Solimonas aquatica]SEQ20537.1 N-methylhydantoinase A/oxoprolinase/acetone carboxylase, beta subunit [Solimonas aquatica]
MSVSAQSMASQAGKLINIDNGGTLTDFCLIDGEMVYRTKSVTTPYDLSKCFFDGLRKLSSAVYGKEDLLRLLLSTDHIRYSTTQGTNALVERKGQRLGLLLSDIDAARLQADAQSRDVFASLVATRVASLDLNQPEAELELNLTRAINNLASEGANRIVVAVGGAGREAAEQRLKRILLKKFPPHLLGAIPLLYSHEVVQDEDDSRRVWSALFNAFLHPAMERFLYNAEHRLREYKTKNPLLIFRNDGASARISRTAAVKTYSSGPRGGAEGGKALAQHYGFKQLLGMDIGGTTTDLSLVSGGQVRTERRGRIEGVSTSLPLCDVLSVGVGGSSIIKVVGERIQVGPESVGGAPGPACFGLGGTQATITDAFLVLGLLDPASYFGGELKIDIERARAAISEHIAKPLKLSVEDAAQAMEQAWVLKVADALKAYARIDADTTLAAFGGGGPFVACRIAEAAGIRQVVIPGLAAVFSAFGIGFSDIAHEYELPLASRDAAGLRAAREQLLERAKRGMFAEGFDLASCQIESFLQHEDTLLPLSGEALPAKLPAQGALSLLLKVTRPIARAQLSGSFGKAQAAAKPAGKRELLAGGKHQAVPLYRVEEQSGGVKAAGPCVLEESFFTGRVEAGWQFEINAAGDILLSRA